MLDLLCRGAKIESLKFYVSPFDFSDRDELNNLARLMARVFEENKDLIQLTICIPFSVS